jgi:hypothetical protein
MILLCSKASSMGIIEGSGRVEDVTDGLKHEHNKIVNTMKSISGQKSMMKSISGQKVNDEKHFRLKSQ